MSTGLGTGPSRSPWKTWTRSATPCLDAFSRASSTASALTSVAYTSTSGAATAIETPITPEPVPTSATRIASPVDELERSVHERLRRRARSEDATGRGEELEAVESCLHKNCGGGRLGSAPPPRGERYRDGESRLPGTGDADARQRQLTRMGNAAAGAGLALVMQGRGAEARAWFDRACDRYRESWEHAPPGSWGRPIGDAQGAHPRRRLGRSRARRALDARRGRRRRRVADRPLRRRARVRGARRVGRSARAPPMSSASAMTSRPMSPTRLRPLRRPIPSRTSRPSSRCSSRSRRARRTSRIFPPRTRCSSSRRSPNGAVLRLTGSSRSPELLAVDLFGDFRADQSVEDGGWKNVVKTTCLRSSSSASSSFSLNSRSSSRAFSTEQPNRHLRAAEPSLLGELRERLLHLVEHRRVQAPRQPGGRQLGRHELPSRPICTASRAADRPRPARSGRPCAASGRESAGGRDRRRVAARARGSSASRSSPRALRGPGAVTDGRAP